MDAREKVDRPQPRCVPCQTEMLPDRLLDLRADPEGRVETDHGLLGDESDLLPANLPKLRSGSRVRSRPANQMLPWSILPRTGK